MIVHVHTFSTQGDIIVIMKKIDDNWYQGYLGDQKGIFPTSYVETLEGILAKEAIILVYIMLCWCVAVHLLLCHLLLILHMHCAMGKHCEFKGCKFFQQKSCNFRNTLLLFTVFIMYIHVCVHMYALSLPLCLHQPFFFLTLHNMFLCLPPSPPPPPPPPPLPPSLRPSLPPSPSPLHRKSITILCQNKSDCQS